jgi:hypothetical protein
MKAKRIITIALVAIMAVGAFAANGSVKLNGNVGTTDYALNLKYAPTADAEAVAVGTDKALEVFNGSTESGTAWDLQSASAATTGLFSLYVNGNEPAARQMDVTITAGDFKNTTNDKLTDSVKVTTYIGSAEKTSDSFAIAAGKHVDAKLAEFHFGWTGNADLPAGDYVSDISITYSVK